MPDSPHELAGLGSDALSLLDQIEQVIGDGKRVPFTTRVIIDEEALGGLIEDLRARMPEELREARWLLMERDQIISEARTQAMRILDEAKNRVATMADDAAITREAQSQAQEIVDKARHVAREIRYGALEYADRLLGEAVSSLEKSLAEMKTGRSQLKVER